MVTSASRFRCFGLATLLTVAGIACGGPARSESRASDCDIGAYAGPSDDFVVVIKRPTSSELRYYFRDGRFGPPGDSVVKCAEGAVLVARGGASARWPAIPMRQTVTRFRSGDAMLEGLLIEPPGADNTRPLAVMVHGSENTGSVGQNPYPYIFAAQGIAAFVFDKRGTGRSEGTYNQNFDRLGADVVADSAEAKRLARGRFGRFGLFGGSQGGWIAPRAANDAGAQFVAVGFGLLINPLEEDAAQVASELRALGFDDDVLAQAREVTAATGAVMAAHFEDGYEALATARRRYGSEPWFGQIRGEFTGDILALDEETLRREGRHRFDNLDIDWRYDAMHYLRAVKVPQLWIIAGDDREAPPSITIERLQGLRSDGYPIEIALFPETDHGMVEFETAADGTRAPVRITDGYFRLLGDWILGRKRPPYGSARVVGLRGSEPKEMAK